MAKRGKASQFQFQSTCTTFHHLFGHLRFGSNTFDIQAAPPVESKLGPEANHGRKGTTWNQPSLNDESVILLAVLESVHCLAGMRPILT